VDFSPEREAVPDDWPRLPEAGEQYERSLTVREGSELLTHPAMPWSAWGSVAVFRVTGDPRAVVESFLNGRAGAERFRTRDQDGARIRTAYTNSPSPSGSVWAETVERDGQTTYLIVEHDATD
jgi:hypothetical protein